MPSSRNILSGLAISALSLVVAFGTEASADTSLPAARWDDVPGSRAWTEAALAALASHAAPLVALVPQDVSTWCPGYQAANAEDRSAFWVGLVSALAKHESTWRPEVSDSEGRWHGLLQISPGTAEGYGCAAQDAKALKDAGANLSCGLRIMAETVVRDEVVAEGGGGVAADWAPFSVAEKREDMAAWTRAQSYCAE